MNLDINNKKECRKILKELVSTIDSRAGYSDILLSEVSNLSITRDFATADVSNTGEIGIKMRAFDGEKFLESFTTDLDIGALRKTAKELAGKIKSAKPGIKIKDEKMEKSFFDKPKIDTGKVPLTKKVDAVEKALGLMKREKFLKNARVIYDEEITKKVFCSQNRFLTQKLSKVLALCYAMVQSKTGELRYFFEGSFGPGFESAGKFSMVAKKASEGARNLINAKRIVPGKYHCILGPPVTGLLAHESFGHGMESDTVYKERALAREWIGKSIAGNFVSILDDPSMRNCHGSYYFDDEGQIAKPTYLIKNGKVNDYITEMLTAHKLNVKRSANGRCESFDHKNYARMSITFFAKGKSHYKSMIKNVKDGIFIYGRGGGMEDPKGWGVQIQGNTAQRIKNGKLVNEYYDDVGITGYLPTILGNIKEVSKESKISNIGRCGKGHKEWVPVSEGGSYLRIENLDLA